MCVCVFFFQAEDGIRDLVRSRGLGDVYKRQKLQWSMPHDELLRFVLDKKLMDIEYIALADEISTDPDAPSVFDVIGDVEVLSLIHI